jgi:hypothetical protein
MWFGESEANVREIFETLTRLGGQRHVSSYLISLTRLLPRSSVSLLTISRKGIVEQTSSPFFFLLWKAPNEKMEHVSYSWKDGENPGYVCRCMR